ncbi:hypothetical protein HII36_29510 [Nonomuraea sp. NN258]|uniref:hypothetical protein n=1 Tax=Nonomuraea antri TaxID=2730852 RepID=UPI001567E7AF|nr:hypothetical protein [Nonomuraea antri]NRQ35940.1 hypothetical protein [Nonomuraea antri]
MKATNVPRPGIQSIRISPVPLVVTREEDLDITVDVATTGVDSLTGLLVHEESSHPVKFAKGSATREQQSWQAVHTIQRARPGPWRLEVTADARLVEEVELVIEQAGVKAVTRIEEFRVQSRREEDELIQTVTGRLVIEQAGGLVGYPGQLVSVFYHDADGYVWEDIARTTTSGEDVPGHFTLQTDVGRPGEFQAEFWTTDKAMAARSRLRAIAFACTPTIDTGINPYNAAPEPARRNGNLNHTGRLYLTATGTDLPSKKVDAQFFYGGRWRTAHPVLGADSTNTDGDGTFGFTTRVIDQGVIGAGRPRGLRWRSRYHGNCLYRPRYSEEDFVRIR